MNKIMKTFIVTIMTLFILAALVFFNCNNFSENNSVKNSNNDLELLSETTDTVKASVYITVSHNAGDNPDYLCDGVDDQVQLNAAAAAAANGGTVHIIGNGTGSEYWVSSNFEIKGDNVTVEGDGIDQTIIKLAPNSSFSTAGILRIKNTYDDRSDNVTVKNFTVDGNRANQSEISNLYGTYSEGNYTTYSYIKVINCPGYGFDPHGSNDTVCSDYLVVDNCISEGNGYDGFTLDMIRWGEITNCVARNNDRHGINLVWWGTGTLVENNLSEYNASTGIKVQNLTDNATINNNISRYNGLEGIYVRDLGDHIITNNTISYNNLYGIKIAGGTNNLVSGNTLRYNDRTPSAMDPMDPYTAEISIDNYEPTTGTVYSTYNDILNNIITTDVQYGIMELPDSDYNTVSGNSVTGYTIGVKYITGSHTN